MEYDDLDDDDKYSDYDDMGDLFILDEMDREDERIDRGCGYRSGCLSAVLLLIAIPVLGIYIHTKML